MNKIKTVQMICQIQHQLIRDQMVCRARLCPRLEVLSGVRLWRFFAFLFDWCMIFSSFVESSEGEPVDIFPCVFYPSPPLQFFWLSFCLSINILTFDPVPMYLSSLSLWFSTWSQLYSFFTIKSWIKVHLSAVFVHCFLFLSSVVGLLLLFE